MADSWDSLTGSLRPRGSYEVGDGLKKILKARAIYYNKKEDPGIKELSADIWASSGYDAEKVVIAFDATIEKHKGVSYLLGCLRGKDYSVPSATYETKSESPKEKNKAIVTPPQQRTNFIRLYRSLRKHPWFKGKPAWVKLFFIELCLDAAWKDHEVSWKTDKIPLKRGQYIILERTVAKEYEQSPRMVHYWLERLENEGMIATATINFKNKKYVAANVAGRVAGNVAEGTIVTICKYDSYQGSINDDVAENVADIVAGNVVQTEECITEEGNPQKKELQAAHPVQKIISSTMIFEIWETERGELPTVRVRQYERLRDLVSHLNSLVGRFPVEAWKEIIHRARRCHPDHRVFMSPYFFSKDLGHIDQVLNGLYDKSFERKKHGIAERPGKGNAEEFGVTSDAVARVFKFGKLGKSS